MGETFIGDDDVCLILGDNIFYGAGINNLLESAVNTVEKESKASIFGYYVNKPQRYGVAAFDAEGKVLSIEEKPEKPKSNYAVVGLYFYPNNVVEIAKNIQPSARGELEITTVNQEYLKKNKLQMELMRRGYAWLDTGTEDSLLEAANFIRTIEKRQGLKVACIEETAYEMGYITKDELRSLAEEYKGNGYGTYLMQVCEQQN